MNLMGLQVYTVCLSAEDGIQSFHNTLDFYTDPAREIIPGTKLDRSSDHHVEMVRKFYERNMGIVWKDRPEGKQIVKIDQNLIKSGDLIVTNSIEGNCAIN